MTCPHRNAPALADIQEILSDARARGVTLWVDTQQLRYRAPAGAMTDTLRAELSSRKAEIIEALQDASPGIACAPREPVFVRGPQRRTSPIVNYHRNRWAQIKSGELGLEFVNSTHAALRFPGQLNISALQSSIRTLTARHSILNTFVADTPDDPMFVVNSDRETPLEIIDLSGIEASEVVAKKIATERIWKPFDAGAESQLRVFAIRLSGTEYVVGFVINHFIADAWSVRIVIGELLHAYAAFEAGVEPSLPELPIQYFDYVAGINEWIRSGAAKSSATYWLEYLRNAPATQVPPDFHIEPEALERSQRNTISCRVASSQSCDHSANLPACRCMPRLPRR